jgi:hypothetical protein
MAVKLKIIALVPLILAITGFVLSMLCLFAGTKPNYMESYHIVSLNTTGLGHDQLAKLNTTSLTATINAPFVPEPCDQTNKAKKLACEAKNEVAEKAWNSDAGKAAREKAAELLASTTAEVGELIDKAAQELGIKQFYSLHLMNMCEGYYKPNASTPHAGTNVTECSNQTAMCKLPPNYFLWNYYWYTETDHFDIIAPINQELAQAPDIGLGKLDISKLGIADDLQDGLNNLSTALNVTFVLYAIGIASAGLCILLSLLCIFLSLPLLALLDLFLAALSFLTLLLSSIIITVVGKKAAHLINKFGNKAGLHADRGGKYLALTWSSVAVMGVASIVLGGLWVLMRRERKSGGVKYQSDKGMPTLKQRGMNLFRRRG